MARPSEIVLIATTVNEGNRFKACIDYRGHAVWTSEATFKDEDSAVQVSQHILEMLEARLMDVMKNWDRRW